MKIFIILCIFIWGPVLTAQEKSNMKHKVNRTEEQWKEILSPQQYYVLRQKGTDLPGEGGYTNFFEKGTYHCAACNAQLFESGTKYESHCGWPSFDDAIEGSVEYVLDKSHGMIRTEIICAHCGGHLGHVFDDGPVDTTGKRYCVNTTSLRFEKSRK
jgi:peptide-methionine (R)-S-oxide reductase